MLVLVIDTSSPAVTAAVVAVKGTPSANRHGAQVTSVAERSVINARGHGELLAPSIAAVLTEVGVAPSDVDAVVAGTGPGPFTGLRVGLVTAAVLADLLTVPVYGICSLDGIGAVRPEEPELLVVTDARRHEVYWARYRYGRRVGDPAVAKPADVPLDGLSAVAGAGVDLYPQAWTGLATLPERYPAPVALVDSAIGRVVSGAPSDPLTPLYLRRPDATPPTAAKRVSQ